VKVLFSPHDDDQALFVAFTCYVKNPLVCVVLDSFIQPSRGEIGCSAAERAAETEAACKLLRCEVQRLGIRDDLNLNVMLPLVMAGLEQFKNAEEVYAPAYHDGGNPHHNLIAQAAAEIFGDRLKRYTTYTSDELYKTGDIEVIPGPTVLAVKAQALACYVSQLRINRPHFDAVMGKSEWLLK
jgi:LmbE family N-acetylglucosaminyl deacetylase